MRRTPFFAFQALTAAGAVALLAFRFGEVPWPRWSEILFFALLAGVAFRLRVRYAGNYLGLEAAAIVPAILVLDSAGAAMLVCAAADLATKLITRGRRFTRATLFDVSQLALSYGLAAAFFRPLNRPDATPLAAAALASGVL